MNGFAVAHSRALRGLVAPAVRVEAHLANGLPSFMIVGLPEAAVRESRERVRAAILCCGFEFPHRRITVNLAPADLPKDSGRFDLPIAVGILAAAGHLPAASLLDVELLGELSLDAQLRPIQAALALCIGLLRDGCERSLLVPMSNIAEARLAGLPRLYGADSLAAVLGHLRGSAPLTPVPAGPPTGPQASPRADRSATAWSDPAANGRWAGLKATGSWTGPAAIDPTVADLADVIGQASARRAVEVSAAGGHPLLLCGPPGTGKSMLAERLVGLLPTLGEAEALDVAAIRSSVGQPLATMLGRPPLQAPHHTISVAGLVGGGQPPRPGQASLAQNGVLFLDELPEFRRAALEALREPLETGTITLARGRYSESFPARFLLVAAMNPCPCGYLGDPQRACTCTAEQVRRYRARLSGPLLDRIDIAADMPREPEMASVARPAGVAESTATVAARVAAARRRQAARQLDCNARLPFAELARRTGIGAGAQALADRAARRLQWSMRARHRMLRVAVTLADLAGDATVAEAHVAEAIGLRRPLDRFSAGFTAAGDGSPAAYGLTSA